MLSLIAMDATSTALGPAGVLLEFDSSAACGIQMPLVKALLADLLVMVTVPARIGLSKVCPCLRLQGQLSTSRRCWSGVAFCARCHAGWNQQVGLEVQASKLSLVSPSCCVKR